MHGSVLGLFLGILSAAEVAGRDVLEVGSLNVNGSVRPMVEARCPRSYLGVDIVAGPGVDEVCDAADLPGRFGPDAFDVVVCCEMLEHAADPHLSIEAMVTVLRPGGVIVITTRSPGFVHHHPPDRWRYTQGAFAEILDRLSLQPLMLCDDPEYPGVFVKARKPVGWRAPTPPPEQHWCPDGITPVYPPLRILGLPAAPDGCGYYRMWQPFRQLAAQSGHTVLIPPPDQVNVRPTDEQAASCDVVVRQRPAGRAGVATWRRWKGSTKLVYETDDDILHPDSSSLPHLLDPDVQATVRECLGLADLVTCSTQPLAEVLREHAERVVVIPDCIHADLLTITRPRRERVTICWTPGANHLQDAVLIADPLAAVLDETGAQMHFLGTDYSPVVRRPARFSGWQPNVWDYYASIDGDIGIAPLVDTPFNRSRAPIRALEMAALGIPVVASDLEPYREFVQDGLTGWLCSSEDDWRKRLTDLVRDEGMRAQMGAAAREQARAHTIQDGWRAWAAAYEDLAGWPKAERKASENGE